MHGNLYGSNRLTATERRITELVHDGLTNAEIGAIAGTTECVVKNNLRTIYDKLGFSNRVELALWQETHHGKL